MAENKAIEKKEKKPNWFVTKFQSLKRWAKDVKGELKKVVWPDKKETLTNTGVVFGGVMGMGACNWIFDAVAAGVIRALINLVAG